MKYLIALFTSLILFGFINERHLKDDNKLKFDNQKKIIENEIAERANRGLRTGLGLPEQETDLFFDKSKVSINVKVEKYKVHNGKHIIGAKFETSVRGKFQPHLTNGVVGIGEDIEDSKQTLIVEWYLQYGRTLLDFLTSKDQISFEQYHVNASPQGFRGERPENPPDNLTILRAIKADIGFGLEAYPITIDILVIVEIENVNAECRLNGQVSNNISKRLLKIEWPKSNKGYMFKQYYILSKNKIK